MYSSLPSASKLYVRNTNPSKQRNGTVNQKRKRVRKKPVVCIKRPEGNSLDVVTLVGAESNAAVQNFGGNSEKNNTESERERRVVSFNEKVVFHGESFAVGEQKNFDFPSVCEGSQKLDGGKHLLVTDHKSYVNDEFVTERTIEEKSPDIISDMVGNTSRDSSEEQIISESDEVKICVQCCDEHQELSFDRSVNQRKKFTDLHIENRELDEHFSVSDKKDDVDELVHGASNFCKMLSVELENRDEAVYKMDESSELCEEQSHSSLNDESCYEYSEPDVPDDFYGSSMHTLCDPTTINIVKELDKNAEILQKDLVCNELFGSPTQKNEFQIDMTSQEEKTKGDSYDEIFINVPPIQNLKVNGVERTCHESTSISSQGSCSPQFKKISGDSIFRPFPFKTSEFSFKKKSSTFLSDLKGSSVSLKSLPDVHAKVNALSRTNSLPENCFKLEKSFLSCALLQSKHSTTQELIDEHFDHGMFASPLHYETHRQDSSLLLEYIDCDKATSQTASHETSIANISSLCSQTSSSIIKPLTTKEARQRSYVVGNIRAHGSILGIEELVRYFPDRKVTIFVGTWNMNSQEPPNCLNDFLLPLGIVHVPDIYAIGIQESYQSRSEWEVLMQSTLGPSHVLFTSTSIGVLHLAIFLRRDLVWFCSEPEEASVTTRPGSMVKTKGAVAISFMFFGSSFLFINSHLTAHEKKLKERLADYEKICNMIDLPKSIPLKPQYQGRDVTSRFDYVFWCGDLNFRVTQERPAVLSFVQQKLKQMIPSWELLLQHDQLHQAMCNGTAFHGFEEGIIDFVPSYKFDVGTSSFDSSKQRVPSYTDRVLYRCKQKGSVQCMNYNIVSDILTSDHKPVFAAFEVKIKPGRDNIPLAAGLFKRDIYLEAIRKRVTALEVTNHSSSNSTICIIM